MKRKISIGVLTILTLVIMLTVSNGILVAVPSSNKSKLQALVQDQDIKQKLDVDLKDTQETVKLDESAAIARGKEILGPVYSGQAKQIEAFQVRYTNNRFKKSLQSGTDLTNLPVWMVKFEGITLNGHGVPNGKSKKPHSEIYVVIDANTGEQIEMFSYK